MPGLVRARDVPVRAGRAARGDGRALGEEGDPERLHVEHFQPDDAHVGDGERGAGGTIRFRASGVDACSDGEQPILLAGERAGASLPYGCRMGICHSCVGRLRSGRVRDLRTGRVHGQAGRAAADLRQRARGRRRDRPLEREVYFFENEHPLHALIQYFTHANKTNQMAATAVPDDRERSRRRNDRPWIRGAREPAGAPALRAARAARPRARRDPRRGVRRPRRARLALHPLDDHAAPPARAGARARCCSARATGHCGWPARRAVDREDPREHGDRPQRDARPVGLDERSRHQLPELGLGHGLAGRRVAALAQLRAPHVHQHPRQGPRSGL